MKLVIVAGKFDPVLQGHIDHIIKASKLGDYLIVVTHTDSIVAKSSQKGFCAVPLFYRKILLKGILLEQNIKGSILVGVDVNGTMVNTLKYIRMNNLDNELIYVKGGDRTIENMNQDEIEICKKFNIEIIYGIGDLLSSSSKLMTKIGANFDF